MNTQETTSNDVKNGGMADVSSVKTGKLPPFWKENPTLWFTQVELAFALGNITSDITKFRQVAVNLDQTTLPFVADILTKPPEQGKYDTLKERIISIFGESNESNSEFGRFTLTLNSYCTKLYECSTSSGRHQRDTTLQPFSILLVANKLKRCKIKTNMSVIFKKFILDENKRIIEDGSRVLCEVENEAGDLNIIMMDKENLLEAGYEIPDNNSNLFEKETEESESPSFNENAELDASTKSNVDEWSDESTRLLLDKYADYLELVGPMKRFKNKKLM